MCETILLTGVGGKAGDQSIITEKVILHSDSFDTAIHVGCMSTII